MDVKKLLTATVAGFLVMFVLSYVWHELLMSATYAQPNHSPEPEMLWIVLGYVMLAALMAYMYPTGYQGGLAVSEGFRFGALIGLVSVGPLQLIFTGLGAMPIQTAGIDMAWHIVEQGAGGIVIAMLHAKS